jgi:hypothetical protein
MEVFVLIDNVRAFEILCIPLLATETQRHKVSLLNSATPKSYRNIVYCFPVHLSWAGHFVPH